MDGRGDAARGTRGVGQGWDMAGVGRHVRELAGVGRQQRPGPAREGGGRVA